MRTPLAWSYTSLDDFVNCPRAFYEKRVIKSVKDEGGPHLDWGNLVHKAFELRQRDGTTLPDTLAMHEPYMRKLLDLPGTHTVERKVALDKRRQPCGFFDKNVWFRGIIDYTKLHGERALLIDYKTGKPHAKFKQLKLFALHVFAEHSTIEEVECRFYWTKTETSTGQTYNRRDIAQLWSEFVPDLRQYAEAFKSDTWQPRQSGLCNGWCPVQHCEFWRPKRAK